MHQSVITAVCWDKSQSNKGVLMGMFCEYVLLTNPGSWWCSLTELPLLTTTSAPVCVFQRGGRDKPEHPHHLGRQLRPVLRLQGQPHPDSSPGAQDLQLLCVLLELHSPGPQAAVGDRFYLQEARQHRGLLLVRSQLTLLAMQSVPLGNYHKVVIYGIL